MGRKNERVKKLRVKVIEDTKSGLTHEEVRRKRGVSPSTIAKWTKGKDLKRYCHECGETDPKKLEKHHSNKKESPEHTVNLCANCHSKITRKQLSSRNRTQQPVTVPKATQDSTPKQPTPIPFQFGVNQPNQVMPVTLRPFTPKDRAEIVKGALYLGGSIAAIEAILDEKLAWWERLARLASAGLAFRAGGRITPSSPDPKTK